MRRAGPHHEPGQPLVLGAKHQRRMEWMLLLGSGIVIVTCLFWSFFFAWRAQWLGALLELTLLAVGVLAVILVLQQRLMAAAWLLMGSLMLGICAIGLVLDVPTPLVHRSSHHFLLALGACAYMLLRGQNGWLQHGAMLAFFGAYLVLDDGARFGGLAGFGLPDDVRQVSTWVADVFASLALFMVMYVMQSDEIASHVLEDQLSQALVDEQLVLHYQPQVDADGAIVGAQSLIRWQHPVHGLVPPADFMGLAERSGLILPMGDWMLDHACMQLSRWARQPESAHIQLAVHASAQQLRQPDFVQQVRRTVERHGVQPGRLKLELTESILVDDVEEVIAKLGQLKALGVVLAVDDFGTGYSSLAYLKHLPLDQLKIDRAFVHELLASAKDAAIAKTVISLGHDLGLEVIAEGVETEEQFRCLQSLGCTAFQGFLFSKPLALPDFDKLVASQMLLNAR